MTLQDLVLLLIFLGAFSMYIYFLIKHYYRKYKAFFSDQQVQNDDLYGNMGTFSIFLKNVLSQDQEYKQLFPNHLINDNDKNLNRYICTLLMLIGYDSDKDIKDYIFNFSKDINVDQSLSSQEKERYIYLIENFLYFMRKSKYRFSKILEYKNMLQELDSLKNKGERSL